MSLRRSINPCTAHFRRVHNALPALCMLCPAWMRKHAFVVTLTRKGPAAADGLKLCERWHAALVKRLRVELTFRPIIFAIERAPRCKQLTAVLLLPATSLTRFKHMRSQRSLRLIEQIKSVNVRSYRRLDVEQSFIPTPWAGRTWTSLNGHRIAMDESDVARARAELMSKSA
jgi:hypothetical protein